MDPRRGHFAGVGGICLCNGTLALIYSWPHLTMVTISGVSCKRGGGNAHEIEERCVQDSLRKLQARNNLKDVGISGRILLKCIFKEI